MLTARGRAVALGAVVLGGLALWLRYPALLVPALAALVVLCWAGWNARRATAVQVELRAEPVRVGRGDPAALVAHVTNSRRRASGEASCAAGGPVRGGSVVLPSLAAGGARTIYLVLETGERGDHRVGPLLITRRDPFGLFSRTESLGAATRLVVHPRTEPARLHLGGSRRSLDGMSADAAAGTIEFQRLREYVPGDDLRRVHWRSTARQGRMMVKEVADTLLPSLLVTLDTDSASYPDEGSFERAVDVAASVASSALATGLPVLLVDGGGLRLDLNRGDGAAVRMLDALAATTLSGDSLAALLAVAAGDRRGRALVVVTGRLSAPGAAAVSALRPGFTSVSVMTVDRTGSTDGVPAHLALIPAGIPGSLAAAGPR